MWHPAAPLSSWFALALFLQWAPPGALPACAGMFLLLALVFARHRVRDLLRRTRWLLLTLALLFLFATPGEYLPSPWGGLGMTREGLGLAIEQLSRLLAMLTSLALLHERMGTHGLLAGFYWLLQPFAFGRKTVVRLMLILDFVEHRPEGDWRVWLTPTTASDEKSRMYSLEIPAMRAHDIVVMGGVPLILALWVATA